MEEAFILDEKWRELILEAKTMDYKLIKTKAAFAKITEK
jgi:hypothetical protein